MSINKKILWVLPKYTFPINDGARVASSSLLSSISNKYTDIDIAILSDNKKPAVEPYQQMWNINQCFVIPRPSFTNKYKKNLFLLINFLIHPFTALTLSYFNNRKCKRLLQKIVINKKYDYIIFDGLHPWKLFSKLELGNAKIIYRAHNVESDLWKTAAQKSSNILVRKFFIWQEQLIASVEEELISRADQVWTIALEDKNRFNELYPRGNYVVVPVGMKFSHFRERDYREPIKLFFLGRLDWPPNRDGIRWFIEQVWPVLSSSHHFELHVAGSGNGEWIADYQHLSGITFHGRVENLDIIYQQMHIAIMPIFFGSGTRIKVIESVQKGIPIISTNMGVQGSGLRTDCFILANNQQEWIDKLQGLDFSHLNSMAKRAWEQLRGELDYSIITTQLVNALGIDIE